MSDGTRVQTVRHINVLRQLPLFRHLSPGLLGDLLASGRFLTCAKRETILQEGDPAVSFYILLEGRASLYTVDTGGSMNTLAMPEPPAILALTALFNAQVYPASCEAVTACTLLRLPRRAVIDMLMGEPDSRIAVLRSLAASWYRLYDECVMVRSKTPMQRLTGYLLGLSDSAADPHRISLPISMQRLASQIGVTAENLSRYFVKLEEHGVRRRRGGLDIETPCRLRSLFAENAECGHVATCSGDRRSCRHASPVKRRSAGTPQPEACLPTL